MQLHLTEQNQAQVLKLFDELDELTREPFAGPRPRSTAAGHELTIGVKPAELRPWHYHDPFFQEPPAVFDVDLD